MNLDQQEPEQEQVTCLSKNCLKDIIQNSHPSLESKFVLQVLNLKDVEESKKERRVDLGINIQMNSQDETMNVLILTKPPIVIFKELKTKIGLPKDFDQNLKDGFKNEKLAIEVDIPKHIIQLNKGEKQKIETQLFNMQEFECAFEKEIEENQMKQCAKTDDSSPTQSTSCLSSPAKSDMTDTSAQPKEKIQIKIQQNYMPIKALTSFNYEWTIKARVIKKHETKTWKNKRSEGQLLNIDLMDSYGTQIQSTFFREALRKYGSMIEERKVYLFSNGQVKISNQKFTSIKNDFCLVFDKHADIVEVPDDDSIDENGYSFVGINEIQKLDKSIKKVIDIIGVLINSGQITEVTTKNGQIKEKRLITIADDTNLAIQVCFWAEMVHKFDDISGNPVIALKSVRVVDFVGNQLQSGFIKNLNKYSPKESPIKQISDQIKNDEKSLYLACPEDNCRKKVVEIPDNNFRCDSCNKIFDTCVPTYMLLVKLQDQSESVYVNFYREQGFQIMNQTADAINNLQRENRHDLVNEAFFDAQFKNYQIQIKAKRNRKGENSRLSYYATKILNHSFNQENLELLKRLDIYGKLIKIDEDQKNQQQLQQIQEQNQLNMQAEIAVNN
ncbi:replication protein a 70 kda dna-binding subunit-like [Stylonychia lemnae]|uniref:Replication protein a 70 kDa dna-binding subunit-like n=1 Tax=Stylonychia lemnae TaxID=5949 RepID=A0A078AEB7_STYLE|nr:replication protein a 70 kda dna-binding subunit-like [Stylonychia lemnae]|eukprot:CDW80181.1 replication protein a 70 kda dna-binding subunit-like [Stylonychia lemnae]